MSATREQQIPEDPNNAGPVNNRACARTQGHCLSCPVIVNSPFLCVDELRRIGCCGNTPCDIIHPTILDTLRFIPTTNIHPYAPPGSFRYAAYRHLVCLDGFGVQSLTDPQRLILNCCIIHRVRCTWPSPTVEYTGHVTTAGFLPIHPA